VVSQGIVVLGSTGSIGESTLDVLARHPDRYHVVALSAHSNFTRLAEQCSQYQARFAVISDSTHATALQSALDELGCKSAVLTGHEALSDVVRLDETDVVMAAIVGAAGLLSTLHAVQAGKRLLLANKESMVIAGELFRKAARPVGHSCTANGILYEISHPMKPVTIPIGTWAERYLLIQPP